VVLSFLCGNTRYMILSFWLFVSWFVLLVLDGIFALLVLRIWICRRLKVQDLVFICTSLVPFTEAALLPCQIPLHATTLPPSLPTHTCKPSIPLGDPHSHFSLCPYTSCIFHGRISCIFMISLGCTASTGR
jgi:hypothetical protein